MATAQSSESNGNECRKLLVAVKVTVERLLATQSSNVWKTYGSLPRLCNDVECILKHGLRTEEGVRDHWQFFLGLRVLRPTLAPRIEKHRVTFESQGMTVLGHCWVRQSLEEHSLSNQLKILLQDKQLLQTCYQDGAFFTHPGYTNAFLLCLRAVEQNDLMTLADLSPELLVKPSQNQWYPTHVRTRSFPLCQGLSVDNKYHHRQHSLLRSSSFVTQRTFPHHYGDVSLAYTTMSRPSDHSFRPLTRTESSDSTTLNETSCLPSATLFQDNSLFNFVHENLENLNSNSYNMTKKSDCDSAMYDDTDVRLLTVLKKLSDEDGEIIEQVVNDAESTKTGTQNGEMFGISGCKETEKLIEQNLPLKPQDLQQCNGNILHDQNKLEHSNVLCCISNRDFLRKRDSVTPSRRRSDSDITLLKKELEVLNHDGFEVIASSLSSRTLTVDYVATMGEEKNSSASDLETSFPSRTRRRRVSSRSKRSLEKNKENIVSISNSTSFTSADGDLTKREGKKLLKELEMKNASVNISSIHKSPRLTHQRSRSDDVQCYTKKHSHSIPNTMSQSATFPTPRHRSFLEEGGRGIQPATECFFPRPLKGQSLTSFLSSQDFRSCAELDRENSHFSISEALISVIEQIKWNETLKHVAAKVEEDEEESDEEIQNLKQRIFLRRRERQQEKAQVKKGVQLLSDGRTDTTTSASPTSSPYSSADYYPVSESSSADSVDELVLSGDEAENASQLVALRDNGLSLSMASLYSEADIQRGNCAVSQIKSPPLSLEHSSSLCKSLNSSISAESVALSLLKKFSDKQLPKASELEWLVSEQEAPQRLLPLPMSWPVSPDDSDQHYYESTRLRGNLEWAPPRPQIICTIHPPSQKKVAVAKQNNRCAGCGVKIEPGYIKRFRYCEYLGKVFCYCCHSNQRTFIPGHILCKWDFSKCCVSDFSKDLLDSMHYDPLFNVNDINPSLYQQEKALNRVREYRLQLHFLQNYISTCRRSESLQEELKHLRPHLYEQVHEYSINDLLQTKNGELIQQLKLLVSQALEHVRRCVLCKAKGFICEFCNNEKDIIFPFQIHQVFQCDACSACYHKTCFAKQACPKCKRINERKCRMSQTYNENEYED